MILLSIFLVTSVIVVVVMERDKQTPFQVYSRRMGIRHFAAIRNNEPRCDRCNGVYGQVEFCQKCGASGWQYRYGHLIRSTDMKS